MRSLRTSLCFARCAAALLGRGRVLVGVDVRDDPHGHGWMRSLRWTGRRLVWPLLPVAGTMSVMDPVERHRANLPRVVSEMIDGEVLLMDMVTGTYYSCDGASALAWTGLAGGATVDELVRALVERFDVDPAIARSDAEGFVTRLVAVELLVAGSPGAAASSDPFAGFDGVAGVYAPLAIEGFDDLADLILLDPVHDVSEAGWPHTPG